MMKRTWYPTRASCVPHFTKRRQHFFKSILAWTVEENSRYSKMTQNQFLLSAALYQTNIYYSIQLMEILKHVSAMGTFISVLFIHLIISIPLFTLFTFLSSYSKKTMLKFWECLPILRGVGYVIIFVRFVYALYFVYFCATALICMIDISVTTNVVRIIGSCEDDKYNICLTMYPTEVNNLSCPTPLEERNRSEFKLVSTQFYVREKIMQYDIFNRNKFGANHKMLIAVSSIWCAVFLLTLLEPTRIRNLLLTAQDIYNVSALVMICIAVFGCFGVESQNLNVAATPNQYFWVYLFLHATDTFILLDAIWVGAMKPPSISATKAGCLVGLVKMLVIFTVIVYSRAASQQIISNYKLKDPRCLVVYGHDIMFAFIPDALYRINFGVFLSFIWYQAIFWTTFSTTIYSVISIVNSLMDYFKVLRNHRLSLYIVYCSISAISTLLLCSNLTISSLYFFHYYTASFLTIICLFLASLGLVFVYSTNRILDDYLFTYSHYPNRFLVFAWKFSVIATLGVLGHMIIHIKYYAYDKFPNYRIMILAFCKNIIFLLPIFILISYKCYIVLKSRRKKSLLLRFNDATKPSKHWGPPEIVDRTSRNTFLPQKNRRMKKCTHRCMLNSDKYHMEISKEHKNLDILEWELEHRGETEEAKLALEEIRKINRIRTSTNK